MFWFRDDLEKKTKNKYEIWILKKTCKSVFMIKMFLFHKIFF